MKRWKRTGAILLAGMLIASVISPWFCSAYENDLAAEQGNDETAETNKSIYKARTEIDTNQKSKVHVLLGMPVNLVMDWWIMHTPKVYTKL